MVAELNELEKEYKFYTKSFNLSEKDIANIEDRHNCNLIMDLIEELSKKKKPSFIYKISFYLKFKTSYKKIFNESITKTIDILYLNYYQSVIKEQKDKINSLNKQLVKQDFNVKLKEYQQESMICFKAFLLKKYKDKEERTIFSNNDLYFNIEDIIKEYPVILSTTYSLKNISKYEYLYDYVIIDEASQVDIISGALSLSVAKNAVIVGDSMQLPHVVTQEYNIITDNIYSKYEINNVFRYSNSLLELTKKLFKNNIPKILLREHYRCHPDIINFCNKKFYHSELIIHTKSEDNLPLSLFISVEGNHARGHYNQRQIDIIINEVLPQIDKSESNGIITPFREQANKLIQAFKKSDIDADTVHKYQGRERDVIIISTVSNSIKPGSFVDDINLINVAISRAKKKLILVTSKNILENNKTNISDLVDYIRYNNFDIQESKL